MKTPADHYRDMAERIERNSKDEFAGAILLVPPEGEPIELLLVNPVTNPAMFWSTVAALVQVAAREFEERARSNDPFRR